MTTIPELPDARDRVKGKVAIVTGAGTRGEVAGVGQAAAILLAAHGAKVLVVDVDAERAQATAATINALGHANGEAAIFVGDMTSSEACRTMVEQCVERFDALHVLVNNVAMHGPGMVTDLDEELWQRSFDVNLTSAMLACRYAVPAMAAAGGGSIVNIASIDGVRAGQTRNLPYAVAKGGMITMTTHMAAHHARQNVRANVIVPGPIYGSFVSNIAPEVREARRKVVPLGIEGTAWDIAWATLFLASDEARWISGVALPVDAGLFATTPLTYLENTL